jgi:hypothetical protein
MKNYEPMTIEFRPMSEFPKDAPAYDLYNCMYIDGHVCGFFASTIKERLRNGDAEFTHFAPVQKTVVKDKYAAMGSKSQRLWWVVERLSGAVVVAADLTQAQAEAVAKLLNEMEENQ